MNTDIRKYSQQLQRLTNEHYQQLTSFEEYRAQRKMLLDQLEAEAMPGGEERTAGASVEQP
jgi:hypothetical protein